MDDITVSQQGVVTAIASGSTEVTARAGKLTASITINVTDNGFTGTRYVGKVTTNGGTLNMREGAGTDYNVVGKLALGTQLIVYGEAQDGWYAVYGETIDGTMASGYVSAQWVTLSGKYAYSLALKEYSASITVDDTYTLEWTVDPEDVEITFASSDTNIATVDEKGVITAINSGKAEISVTAGGKTVIFAVTVKEKPKPKNLIPGNGISVSEGYIWGVKEKTTTEQLAAMFENDEKYLVINSSGLEYAGTGTTVTLIDRNGSIIETATVVVLGDCDGNGEVSSTDYLMTRRIVLGTYQYTDIQYEAALTSGMPAVTATDFLMIRRHVLGTYDIYTQTSYLD